MPLSVLLPLIAVAVAQEPAVGERSASVQELLRAATPEQAQACGDDLDCLVAAYQSFVPSVPGQAAPGDPHFDLEVLYTAKRFEQGLALTQARLEQEPSDLALAWMEARFYYELGELHDEDFDKEAWYEQMLARVERALDLHPADPHLLFLHGLAMGRLGTTRGVLATLFYVDDVEAAWLAAEAAGTRYASLGLEEHLPCDHALVLGIFYRIIPDSWIIELITDTRGDLDKSLAYHESSCSCSPDRIRSLIERAVSELCIGHSRDDAALLARGHATLAHIQSLSPSLPTDFIDQEHAVVLAAHPELACGYSRDGMQELDTRELEAGH
jgi:hypothetical protein